VVSKIFYTHVTAWAIGASGPQMSESSPFDMSYCMLVIDVYVAARTLSNNWKFKGGIMATTKWEYHQMKSGTDFEARGWFRNCRARNTYTYEFTSEKLGWRRGWDSNPQNPCGFNGFQDGWERIGINWDKRIKRRLPGWNPGGGILAYNLRQVIEPFPKVGRGLDSHANCRFRGIFVEQFNSIARIKISHCTPLALRSSIAKTRDVKVTFIQEMQRAEFPSCLRFSLTRNKLEKSRKPSASACACLCHDWNGNRGNPCQS